MSCRDSKLSRTSASPREGGGGNNSGAFGVLKTIALFAIFAVPVGLVIERDRTRRQICAEKAAFRRLGWDWNMRSRF